MKKHLRRLIAPVLLIIALIFPLTITEGQRRRQKQRSANQQTQGQQSEEGKTQRKTIEGVVIRNNVATLKPGYEFVKESENVVAVSTTAAKKKKKKETTGNLKCGCVGEGRCTISVSGNSALCSGDCSNDGCTMLVTVGKISPAVP